MVFFREEEIDSVWQLAKAGAEEEEEQKFEEDFGNWPGAEETGQDCWVHRSTFAADCIDFLKDSTEWN